MAVLWQYYLGIAIGTLMTAGFVLAKAPIFLIFVAGIWLFYATLRCPIAKHSSGETGDIGGLSQRPPASNAGAI